MVFQKVGIWSARDSLTRKYSHYYYYYYYYCYYFYYHYHYRYRYRYRYYYKQLRSYCLKTSV